MKKPLKSFVVNKDFEGSRVDRFLKKQFPYIPQSLLEKNLRKKNTLASKRILISKLQDQSIVKKITTTLLKRYEKRNGGYSRVVRSGYRYGDNAPKAFIELVDKDFNAKGQDSGPSQKKVENKDQEKAEVKKDKK